MLRHFVVNGAPRIWNWRALIIRLIPGSPPSVCRLESLGTRLQFPNLSKLAIILAVLPVTTATTVDRSFSCMKLIKTRLQIRMGEDTVVQCAFALKAQILLMLNIGRYCESLQSSKTLSNFTLNFMYIFNLNTVFIL